jgi:hypothetical protein
MNTYTRYTPANMAPSWGYPLCNGISTTLIKNGCASCRGFWKVYFTCKEHRVPLAWGLRASCVLKNKQTNKQIKNNRKIHLSEAPTWCATVFYKCRWYSIARQKILTLSIISPFSSGNQKPPFSLNKIYYCKVVTTIHQWWWLLVGRSANRQKISKKSADHINSEKIKLYTKFIYRLF